MRLPVIRGVIERRILANYRVEPEVLARLLPPPFRPKVVRGFGIAGICLIRLGGIGPRWWPGFLGISSENAAHRIAVEWEDKSGAMREGVFIPRRDTSSRLNVMAGGRVFAGVHQHAVFDVKETAEHFHIGIESDDGGTQVLIEARVAEELPKGSVFGDLETASAFFKGGSLGYSPSASGETLDGLELRSLDWKVEALEVERFESSFFDDRKRFPAGSLEFDCGLLMRGMRHEWREKEEMIVECGEEVKS